MGYLVKFTDKSVFEVLWEVLNLPTGKRPQSISEMRAALQVEDNLLAISDDLFAGAQVKCPKCKESFPFIEAPIVNEWRIEKPRTLKADAGPVFFEQPAFDYIKELLKTVQPIQAKVRAVVALYDLLDDSEKNWKGNEPELRAKLEAAAA